MTADEIVGIAFAVFASTALLSVTVLIIFGTVLLIKIGLEKKGNYEDRN